MPRTDQETVIPADRVLKTLGRFTSQRWTSEHWLEVLNWHLDTIFDFPVSASEDALLVEHLNTLSAIQEHMMRANLWQYKGMIRESIEERVRVGFSSSERDMLRRLETGAHVIRVVVDTNEQVMGTPKGANEE